MLGLRLSWEDERESTTHESAVCRRRAAAFMSCAFPFHPPMKVANLTFISYNTYLLIYKIFII